MVTLVLLLIAGQAAPPPSHDPADGPAAPPPPARVEGGDETDVDAGDDPEDGDRPTENASAETVDDEGTGRPHQPRDARPPSELGSPLGTDKPAPDEDPAALPDDAPSDARPAPPPDPASDPADDAHREDEDLVNEHFGPLEAGPRTRAPPEEEELDEHLDRRRRLRDTTEPPPPIEPLPLPFVLGTQVALAVGSPLFLGFAHYLLTAFTCFTWPVLIYPLVVGYAVTCVGNSFGRRDQGALFPMLAALAASCGGWIGLGALVGTVVLVGGAAATNTATPIGTALSLLLVALIPVPPIAAGVAASAVWAFVDTDGMPAARLLGRPRMMSEGSDTERFLRRLLGARELPPPRRAVGRPQRF